MLRAGPRILRAAYQDVAFGTLLLQAGSGLADRRLSSNLRPSDVLTCLKRHPVGNSGNQVVFLGWMEQSDSVIRQDASLDTV